MRLKYSCEHYVDLDLTKEELNEMNEDKRIEFLRETISNDMNNGLINVEEWEWIEE